ncbi:uncharacterized protein FA14DRAFT_49441 [Meira miltonrushii]|uniref:Uncharacterized protein n=1 Tax=Meira miltonrushii TaxID=1280837 RepID=A0A316VEF1_9BASI|nr:uncharacterized protein FA14DRAFT_49441 [Meira miltonrushii]PWN35962.1 hypothetical protein FA14DRAFT_49441 [Meira miltonrushii]
MLRSYIASLALITGLLTGSTLGQTFANNVTGISGTWSTGSGHVRTGLGFFNPITKNFTMPSTSGTSYSFTDDGFFETSTFTYKSNPQVNRCFTAALSWQHGKFTFNANNSLSLSPFPADGFVQVISPCAGQTVQMFHYSQFELIPMWNIYTDPHPGFQSGGGSAYAMTLYNDGGNGQAGAAKNVMWLVERPPAMLPTEQLYQEVLNSVGAEGSGDAKS